MEELVAAREAERLSPPAAARTADVTGARRTLKAMVGLGLALWLLAIER